MEELLTMFATDDSPAEISDAIKNILYTKSAEKIEGLKPAIASQMFNFDAPEEES